MSEILKWILSLFIVAPWWVKLIVVVIILAIIVTLISWIGAIICMPFYMIDIKRKEKEKIKVDEQIREKLTKNPEEAFYFICESLEKEMINYSRYEEYLNKIAEEYGHIGSALKLIELYEGKVRKDFKNEEKYQTWLKYAAHAGNIESIKKYYGFGDYDLASKDYDDIIQALNNTSAITQNEKDTVTYLKGITNFKATNFNIARNLFEEIVSSEYEQSKNYMLFRCAIEDEDILYAEKILEKAKLKVPAKYYLKLYNYYVSKRNDKEHSYAVEIKYIEMYAACKEANRETVNKIGSDTYYNFALVMQNEKNNIEMNELEILKAYKKATDYGNVDALFYLGKYYWLGVEPRDYYRAIQFMGKAAKKGHEQASQILEKYGFDGILVKTMQTEKTEYRFLNEYTLAVSSKTLQWFQTYYGIKYQGINLATVFRSNYIDMFKSFDQLVNGIHQLYADYIAYMLQWCIRLLMFFGVDTYSAEDLIEQCDDLSLLDRVPKFEQALEQIDYRAKELNAQLYYAQSTRGVWSGTGFGTTLGSTIKATVKASVAADVMNIGSGLLHGIGDRIVKSTNNAELKKMGDKLFSNPETLKEFESAVLSACTEIADVVMDIMEEHCDMKLEQLEGTIEWKNELLENIDDRSLRAKIDNNLTAGNYEYTYALLIEALRREPVNSDVFQKIFEITVRRGGANANSAYKSCLRYAGDFNLVLSDLQRSWAETMLATRENDNGLIE